MQEASSLTTYRPDETSAIVGARNRMFQLLARNLPGATSLRVWLHRRRGVRIGQGVFIGTDVIIDTAIPRKVWIGDDVVIGMRSTLVGHSGNLDESHVHTPQPRLVIEDQVFIGPGVLILPNTRIGKGSVVVGGSVVMKSVPPHTMVQGNPAVPVAMCGIPLLRSTNMWEFYRHLKKKRSERMDSAP